MAIESKETKRLGGKTILAQIATDPEIKKRIAEEDARETEIVDKARLVALEIWLDGYRKGQVTFDTLCRGLVAAASALPDGKDWREGGYRLIGYAVTRALEKPPRRKGRKNAAPATLITAAAGLARLAHEREGLPLARSSRRLDHRKPTAFSRAAEILARVGVPGITERQIEDWCADARKLAYPRGLKG